MGLKPRYLSASPNHGPSFRDSVLCPGILLFPVQVAYSGLEAPSEKILGIGCVISTVQRSIAILAFEDQKAFAKLLSSRCLFGRKPGRIQNQLMRSFCIDISWDTRNNFLVCASLNRAPNGLNWVGCGWKIGLSLDTKSAYGPNFCSIGLI